MTPGHDGSDGELHLLRLLRDLNRGLKHGRDVSRALRYGLRKVLEFFGATEGCIAVLPSGRKSAELMFTVPQRGEWDLGPLTRYIRGEKAQFPRRMLVARLKRHDRLWGALAIRSGGRAFGREDLRAITLIAATLNEHVDRIDRERIREVRAGIDRKILEHRQPKALFYEILHGLRSLIDYDHSASVLICDDDAGRLEIVAEQIAWEKAKSRKVGSRLRLTDAVRAMLREGTVYVFDRSGRSWRESKDRPAVELAELLDYNSRCRESAILCAPLVTRDDVLGLLKIAACDPGTFGAFEMKLVSGFLPQASVALHNLQRAESLQLKMIEAERKHAMADLARGVSHDVNNALGSILPLVQQMQADLADGEIEIKVAAEDLREIERSVQVCRRIFGGMLSFARSGARTTGHADVPEAVECTLGILRERMQRQGIEVDVDLPSDLPPLDGAQDDLQRILLNLLSNAGDSMPSGGVLRVRARAGGRTLRLVVEDTGCGIAAEDIARIQEPFVTTKATGTGLGLSICRSIIWQLGGKLEINSAPDKGTRVTVKLPTRRGRRQS